MPHKFEIGVKAVVLNKARDKVLFLTSRDNRGDEILTFPGGRMEDGEDLVQTLKRELKEELDFTEEIHIEKLLCAQPRYFNQDNGAGLMLIIVLTEISLDKPSIEKEHIQLLWLGVEDIKGTLPLKIKGAILDNVAYQQSAIEALEVKI